MNCCRSTVVWLVLVNSLLAQEQEPQLVATPEEIVQFIKQLDADEFGEREEATETLIKIGEPAEAALQKLVADPPSAESKQRAARALALIDRARLQRNALQLDLVFRLARKICKEQAKPTDIDPVVEKILAELGKATNREDLKAPVKVENCAVRAGRSYEPNTLYVGDDAAGVVQCRNSVTIMDLGGQVSSAQNSVIIAWGLIDVSSCQNCVIIAGADVSISSAQNCVVLAGGRVNINHATKTIVGGGDGVVGYLRDNSTVVNSKFENRVGAGEMVAMADMPGLVLRDKPVMERLLDDKLELTYLSSAFLLLKLPGKPGEYVVRRGSEFSDPLGQPLEGLEGWTLSRSTHRFAVLEKGDERTYLRLER